MASLPEIKVTIFSDYICPFCYLGHHRLFRLRDEYDLKINWCFVEIHPETSEQGNPIESLNYSSQQWQKMLLNLKQIAAEENIPLAELSFIANSKNALLLSEATKQCGRKIFYDLHEKLFHAYFVEGKNIGDKAVLNTLAIDCGVDTAIIESAWSNKQHQQRLAENLSVAQKTNIQSVPSFIFGNEILTGVVSEADFRLAAQKML